MVYKFEIIGLIFAVIMIYFTYLQLKKKSISKTEFSLWSFFWILGILLILFHDKVNLLINPLNIVRVLDLYMILSFLFLFFIIFYLFVRNKHIEKRLETLTRAISLKKLKNFQDDNER